MRFRCQIFAERWDLRDSRPVRPGAKSSLANHLTQIFRCYGRHTERVRRCRCRAKSPLQGRRLTETTFCPAPGAKSAVLLPSLDPGISAAHPAPGQRGAEPAGGYPHLTAEHLGQMALVGKPGLLGALSRQRRRYASRAKTGQASCGCDSAFPLRGSIGSEFSQRGSGDEMALKIEGTVDGGMHTQEALRGARRLESLHLALSPSERLIT